MMGWWDEVQMMRIVIFYLILEQELELAASAWFPLPSLHLMQCGGGVEESNMTDTLVLTKKLSYKLQYRWLGLKSFESLSLTKSVEDGLPTYPCAKDEF